MVTTSIMNKSLSLCFIFSSDSIMNKMDLQGHLLCAMKLDILCIYVCELLKLNTLKIELRNNIISATPPFRKTVFDLRLQSILCLSIIYCYLEFSPLFFFYLLFLYQQEYYSLKSLPRLHEFTQHT